MIADTNGRRAKENPAADASQAFEPVERDDLVQLIARRMTDAIIEGKLAPGSHVSEAATARALGVSRAPVREAARLLESAGLLVSSPRRGFFVRELKARDLEDLYELRIGVELQAADRLARERRPEAIAVLRAQIERMTELADQDAPELQIDADMAFHRAICRESGNARLLSVFNQIASDIRSGVTLIGRLYDDPHEIAATHLPILEALEAGDRERVREALIYHIDVARMHVVALFEGLEAEAAQRAGEIEEGSSDSA